MGSLYHFIVNPKSGSSVDISVVRSLRDQLRQKGNTIRLELTVSLAHAGELASRARDENPAALVVAGGDGTIRAIAQSMAGADIPILIIPCGTENLLAQQLGIDGSIETTLGMLEHGNTRNLDLGVANDRYFMAVAGVGFDGEVIHRINRFRTGHITHSDYIWPISRTFWEYRFGQLLVEADGQIVCDEPGLVFVGNISRYSVGLAVLPDADCSDGLLDLTVYKCRRRRELLLHSFMTIIRQSQRSGDVVRVKCRQINISSPDENVHVQLDGDPGPMLPLKIKVIPTAAKVLTPPPGPGQKYCPPVKHYHLRNLLLR